MSPAGSLPTGRGRRVRAGLWLTLAVAVIAGCATPRTVGRPAPAATETSAADRATATVDPSRPDLTEERLEEWAAYYRAVFVSRSGYVPQPGRDHPSAAHYAYQIEGERWRQAMHAPSRVRRALATTLAVALGSLVVYGVWVVASLGSNALTE